MAGIDGYTYEFEQRDTHLVMHVKTAYGVLVSSGEGTISGQDVAVQYALADYSVGALQLRVLAGGNEMRGTYRNMNTGLSGSVELRK